MTTETDTARCRRDGVHYMTQRHSHKECPTYVPVPEPETETLITVRMEETCTFSLKFTVAKLAEHLGVAPTLKDVTEALNGDNDDVFPGDALVDVMEAGYDACTDRTITHEVEGA